MREKVVIFRANDKEKSPATYLQKLNSNIETRNKFKKTKILMTETKPGAG
jgi:hypothetical protein